MTTAPAAPPATLVIFGARGDLTRRLLVPALVNLEREGLLDPSFQILGVDHSDGDDASLREHLATAAEAGPDWDRLAERISYLQGDFGDAGLFATLADRLKGDAAFYLATAPGFFGPIADRLGEAKLLDEPDGFRRIVIEKPFGTDLASAKALNAQMLAHLDERQIFRVDHFSGKETIRNILVARFGNPLAEAVWNSRYIDHVQITAAEAIGIGTRGKFYDSVGALRDMVPSHLLQLLATIAMEPPASLDAQAVRDEKAKVVAAIAPVQPGDAARGRYGAGEVGGESVPAYLDTPDIDGGSRTETYAALKLMVATWRWQGTPFYLRTGKALAARDTEVVIRFRAPPLQLFGDAPRSQLVFQLQPDEGIGLEIPVKRPGPAMAIGPARLGLTFGDDYDLARSTGYEALLYDVLVGDHALFPRAGEIEDGWRIVQPLLDAWADGQPQNYAPGTQGPAAADALLARDGRAWHPIGGDKA